MSVDPNSSEGVSEKPDDSRPRAGFTFGRGAMVILALLAALLSGTVVYLFITWGTIDKEMDRLNAIKTITKQVLDDQCAGIQRQDPSAGGTWSWNCNFETGGDYSIDIRGSSQQWVNLHVKTKYQHPVDFENLGGKQTAAVISKLSAELESAGISVRKSP